MTRVRATRQRTMLAALVVGTLALVVLALTLGDYPLSPVEVVRTLLGDDTGFARVVVLEYRLPRVVLAVVVGAALATSGALFQSLTGNPLGSPDVIGFTAGSHTGAIVAITLLGTGISGAAPGAVVGGLATAAVVYLLASRGGLDPFRLIIVGIGVTAMLYAANQYLLLRTQPEVATSASIWGAGSLSGADATSAVVATAGVVALLVGVAAARGPLRQLELGVDTARTHGVHVERTRLVVLVLGVALVALAVATCGPIAFVALTCPQIAARLLRSAGLPLVGSAVTGAFVLLGADLLGQHVIPGGVPVGTLTIVLGGAYLVLLLVRRSRTSVGA